MCAGHVDKDSNAAPVSADEKDAKDENDAVSVKKHAVHPPAGHLPEPEAEAALETAVLLANVESEGTTDTTAHASKPERSILGKAATILCCVHRASKGSKPSAFLSLA